jgi:small subunit ribosomal protein S4
MVKPGDTVAVREKARSQLRIQSAVALAENKASCEWLEVDRKKMEGLFKSAPERAELPSEINENLIVELYSK